MKKANNQAGITLIALVVTIVVLLILAGITISFVLKEGGIFDSARKAGTETRNATVRDYANNAITTLYAECAVAGTDLSTERCAQIVAANFPVGTSGITATAEYTKNASGTSVIKITLTGNNVEINGSKYKIDYDSSSTERAKTVDFVSVVGSDT